MASSHLPLWRGRLLTPQDLLVRSWRPLPQEKSLSLLNLDALPLQRHCAVACAALGSCCLKPGPSLQHLISSNLMCILRLDSMLQCQELQQAWFKPAVSQVLHPRKHPAPVLCCTGWAAQQ